MSRQRRRICRLYSGGVTFSLHSIWDCILSRQVKTTLHHQKKGPIERWTTRDSQLPEEPCCPRADRPLCTLLFLLWTLSSVGVADGGGIRSVPELPWVNFTQPGDLTLGVIMSLHAYNATHLCSDKIRELGALQRLEAIVFAVEEINRRQDILPNITLGFTIVDDCNNQLTALARSLHFIQEPSATATSGEFRGIDCVAVIAAESSSNTIQVADTLSVFRVPQLSYASSSPLLDDKSKYDFFSRTVPSDTMQAKAIVNILKVFEWKYVSVLYAGGSYGSEGYKAIQKNMDDIGYCTATTAEIRDNFNDTDYDEVINKLMDKKQAVVVVLFTTQAQAKSLFQALKRKNFNDNFTWVGGDSIAMNPSDFEAAGTVASGLLSVNFVSSPVDRFEKEFRLMNLSSGARNPWFKEFFADLFECDPSACNDSLMIINSTKYKTEATASLSMNAVYALAHALHLVTMNCSNATSSPSTCFTSEQLRDALRTVKFQGESVNISFDKYGNLQGNYEIRNLYWENEAMHQHVVGVWDTVNQSFGFFDKNKVRWNSALLRKFGWAVPSSVCSHPCSVGYQAVTTQPSCCWYCEPCRDNERTILFNLPKCEVCPTAENFTWPDAETRTRCLPIPATFVHFSRLEGQLLLACDLIVFLVTCTVCAVYLKNRHSRLIKASSRELSLMMLCGHVITCFLVVNFVLEPTSATCVMSTGGFHLSFTWSYGPLLVKTNRIYRIFMPGKAITKKPLFIGSRAQVVIAAVLIASQFLVMCVWMGLNLPTASTTMPSLSVRFVERKCSSPQSGFLVSLVLNLSIMAACGVHAIKTRRLPANFNEAKFITFSVYTTGLLWLSFLPTYFISDSNVVKTMSLGFAMLLNVISCQVFLFLPKLYAVHFVPEKDMHLKENRTTNPSDNHVGGQQAGQG